jgi:hypothetical protein
MDGFRSESISAVGPRPDIKTSRRVSDTKNESLLTAWPQKPCPPYTAIWLTKAWVAIEYILYILNIGMLSFYI